MKITHKNKSDEVNFDFLNPGDTFIMDNDRDIIFMKTKIHSAGRGKRNFVNLNTGTMFNQPSQIPEMVIPVTSEVLISGIEKHPPDINSDISNRWHNFSTEESSVIYGLYYNSSKMEVTVQFHGNDYSYIYGGIPAVDFQEWLDDGSLGEYYNECVKGHYFRVDDYMN